MIRKTVLIAISFILNNQIISQNIVLNGDFEESKLSFYRYSGSNSRGDTIYTIDTFTTHWSTLFQYPNYYKSTLNPYNVNVGGYNQLPKAFKNNAYVYLNPLYYSYDTLYYSPEFFSFWDSTRNDSFYRFRGTNSGIYQRLRVPLIPDSAYILSYRLRNGAGFFKKDGSHGSYWNNFLNQFGAIFSNYLFPNHGIGNNQEKYIPYKPNLQDTLFDTTYRWRLISTEFNADSNYNYINFGQFQDIRKVKTKIVIPSINRFPNNIFAVIYFLYAIDDVRLLPKYQYLDVTPDVNACEGDTVVLIVLSGIGTYTWVETSNPNIVLSTANSLKIIARDTNTMYQVMSPFDTALIPIYATKRKDSILQTINKTICKEDIVKVQNKDISMWNDNKTDTLRLLNQTGLFSYKTKYVQCNAFIQNYNIIVDTIKVKLPNDTILIKCEKDFKIIPTIKSISTISSTKWQDNSTSNSYIANQSQTYWLEAKNTNCTDRDSIKIDFKSISPKNDTFKINSCGSYNWNGTKYTQNGFHTQTLKNTFGCDSIVTLDLKIGLANKVQLSDGINYTALSDNVTYQWYRCNPWRKIVNEIKKTFRTTTRGSYAVVISDAKGCTDTSDCIALYSSGFATTMQRNVAIYPNPFNNHLTIELERIYKETNIKIYDLTGRQILNNNYLNRESIELDLKEISKGTYYLHIETDSETLFFNILKD